MRPIVLLAVLTAFTLPAFGQSPQSGFVYEDRAGTTGHTLVVDGKPYGPYKELQRMIYSNRGQSGLFLVTKRDKTYVLAQGKESGPFAPGFAEERTWVSDDGKFWAVAALRQSEADSSDESEEPAPDEYQLWANGKMYGPYQAVDAIAYSETGGTWIASVQSGEDQYTVLLNGKSQGTFTSVDQVWMSPDGKLWGYAAYKDGDQKIVTTQDRTFTGVLDWNFYGLDLRAPHWAYAIQTGEEDETVVVDGKSLPGYLHFEGFVTTVSARHWGFSANKLTETGDYPVVVIDGQEYVGEGLSAGYQGNQEFFTWTIQEGTKTTVQLLVLP